MKKDLIKKDVVEQLLRRYNPLGLRDKLGHPFEFMRVSELYLHVMIVTWSKFPRGYIETPLLISTLYPHLSFSECKSLAEEMEPMGIKNFDTYEYDKRTGREFFFRFLQAMHKFCSTEFSSDHFGEAYRLLLNRLEIEKLKNEKKDGKEN